MEAISLKTLKQRQRELEQAIEKARKEKEHIDYVLKHFARQPEEGSADQLKIPEPYSIVTRDELLETVKGILRFGGGTMKSGDVYQELQRRGVAPKKTSYDAYMSIWSKDPAVGIVRSGQGIYRITE